jgi:hypothetical protein
MHVAAQRASGGQSISLTHIHSHTPTLATPLLTAPQRIVVANRAAAAESGQQRLHDSYGEIDYSPSYK